MEYSGTRESGVPLETAWCQALEAKENKHMEQRVGKQRGSLQGALVKLPEETRHCVRVQVRAITLEGQGTVQDIGERTVSFQLRHT